MWEASVQSRVTSQLLWFVFVNKKDPSASSHSLLLPTRAQVHLAFLPICPTVGVWLMAAVAMTDHSSWYLVFFSHARSQRCKTRFKLYFELIRGETICSWLSSGWGRGEAEAEVEALPLVSGSLDQKEESSMTNTKQQHICSAVFYPMLQGCPNFLLPRAKIIDLKVPNICLEWKHLVFSTSLTIN